MSNQDHNQTPPLVGWGERAMATANPNISEPQPVEEGTGVSSPNIPEPQTPAPTQTPSQTPTQEPAQTPPATDSP